MKSKHIFVYNVDPDSRSVTPVRIEATPIIELVAAIMRMVDGAPKIAHTLPNGDIIISDEANLLNADLPTWGVPGACLAGRGIVLNQRRNAFSDPKTNLADFQNAIRWAA